MRSERFTALHMVIEITGFLVAAGLGALGHYGIACLALLFAIYAKLDRKL